jgi:CSLREA domain-containing protein
MRDARQFLRTALASLCVVVVFSSTAFATNYVVTTTADVAGVCSVSDCSLRAAIAAANVDVGAHVVLGASQTYALSLGRLTITGPVTVDGNASTISGGALDRVFDVVGNFTLTVNNLTITNGLASGFLSLGGALNIRGATVVLNGCTVTGNSTAVESGSRDDGGGIAVVGSYDAAAGTTALASLTLNNSTVTNNIGSNGGGIVCVLCSLTISKSTISGNAAVGGDGGGIAVVGNSSSLAMTGSALVSNAASGGAGRGGGLSVPFGTSASTLSRDRVVGNTGTIGSAIFENLGTTAATDNWWGCNFGPGVGGTGCTGTPNSVFGAVTTSPQLILKASASPTTIPPLVSSTMTADLTFDSSNADTSSGGTIPDGTIAAFTGTLGTFATPTSPTVNGKAVDVYTAGFSFGSPSLSGQVDGQTISTTIAISGCGVITLSGTTFPIGTVGVVYPATTITQVGGVSTTTFAVTAGALPAGLLLSSAGTVSGVPTAQGTFNFTVTATDLNGCTGRAGYAITINPSPTPAELTTPRPGSTFAGSTVAFQWTSGTGVTAYRLSIGTTFAGVDLFNQDEGTNLSAVVPGLPTGSPVYVRLWSQIASVWLFNDYQYNRNPSGTRRSAPRDFDGDGKADIAIYRPSNGVWYVLLSGQNYPASAAYQWGTSTDLPVSGDFDGDGKADIAIYRPANGTWYILLSSTNFASYASYQWGVSTDVPVPADYDGDGKTDIAIYRPSTGAWFVRLSSTNFGSSVTYQWGLSTDVPVPADYDGDGKADIAIYRPGAGVWYVLLSSTNFTTYVSHQWGGSADVPVAGDYDGDGMTDVAVYRPSTGYWYVLLSSTNFTTYISYRWGGVGPTVTVPADYDGDGKTDIAIYQPASGNWFILMSSTNFGTYVGYQWGITNDIPVLKIP